jgi:hypothetical protein
MDEAPARRRLENGVSVTRLAEFADLDFVEFGYTGMDFEMI